MIVSAGLSPAWQQILQFDHFRPHEVNRAKAAQWCASGKAVNAGIALHHLCGGRNDATLTISTLGGLAFDAFEAEFADLRVPRRWIRTQSPTRICTTILDKSTGTATELVENVAWLRRQTPLPVCIGFGISQPEHVRLLAPVADGLIVGSAIVKRIATAESRPREQVISEVGDYVASLIEAIGLDK